MISFAILIIDFFIWFIYAFFSTNYNDGLGHYFPIGSIFLLMLILNVSLVFIKYIVFKWNHSSSNGRIKSK